MVTQVYTSSSVGGASSWLLELLRVYDEKARSRLADPTPFASRESPERIDTRPQEVPYTSLSEAPPNSQRTFPLCWRSKKRRPNDLHIVPMICACGLLADMRMKDREPFYFSKMDSYWPFYDPTKFGFQILPWQNAAAFFLPFNKQVNLIEFFRAKNGFIYLKCKPETVGDKHIFSLYIIISFSL